MKGPQGGVADILGPSTKAYQEPPADGNGDDEEEEEGETNEPDDPELEALIAAGQQGTTAEQAVLTYHGDVGEDKGDLEEIDEGD